MNRGLRQAVRSNPSRVYNIRLYSLGGNLNKENGGGVLLSDLLARIEKINLNKNRFASKESAPISKQRNRKRDPGVVKKTQKLIINREDTTDAPTEKKEPEKIQVADHPLFRSRLTKRISLERKPRTSLERKPRTGSVRATSDARRTDASKTSGSARPRPSGLPKQMQGRSAQSSNTIPLISKQVVAKDYQPSLTNHFLYGKSTNFQINLTSRVTSLIKSQLIKSNYPYKVPKSIINSTPPNPEEDANKFLLSNNYSLDINHEELKKDIDTIVLGKPQNLPGEGSSPVVDNLNKNPTLNLATKTSMFNIINSKDLGSVFNNAHWKL